MRGTIGYPHVVSTLALFIALGTGAYAVDKVDSGEIQNNSVVSKDLKNKKAVKGGDVVDGSLGGADLADGGLAGADIADGGLAGADIADGGLTGADLADGGLTGADVAGDSLGAAQIDESSLGAAKAWAEITTGGTVRNAHNLTNADVSNPSTPVYPDGIYCFAPDTENLMATPGVSNGGEDLLTIVESDELSGALGRTPASFGCPAGTHWVVKTILAGSPFTLRDGTFQVLFH